MITELRRYHVVDGGMAAMDRRMKDALLPMFAKTGVPQPLAIWHGSSALGEPIMTWMLRWASYEERRTTWAAVAPVWLRLKAELGEIEFVTRTDLTLVDPWPDLDLPSREGGADAMWHLQPAVGTSGIVRAHCLTAGVEMLAAVGARLTFAADLVFGALPQIRLIATWVDTATRDGALEAFLRQQQNAEWIERQHWEALDRITYL